MLSRLMGWSWRQLIFVLVHESDTLSCNRLLFSKISIQDILSMATKSRLTLHKVVIGRGSILTIWKIYFRFYTQ